jgi:hypothetical protein
MVASSSHTMKLVSEPGCIEMGIGRSYSFAAADSGEGAILPTWTAVDSGNVKTSLELWGYMKEDGWNVDVRATLSSIVGIN